MKRNKFFRKLAITAILAIVSFQADAGVKYLVVNFNDGVQVVFPLADNPVIRNSADKFTVETDAETISVLISEIRNYEFSDTTAVNKITEAEATYSVTPYFIAFEGLAPGTQVDVYAMDGRKCATGISEANCSTRIDISALTSGVYVVTYASHSFKFVKK
ncbi:MAG: T9SS type A sorting domain-containing protein [Bacteroides sp.]|nr:T9SS type A sorting domain-containing protein [Bacteroides sp.]